MRHSFLQLNFLTSVRLSLIRRESLTDLQIGESYGESVRLGIYDLQFDQVTEARITDIVFINKEEKEINIINVAVRLDYRLGLNTRFLR